MDFLFSESGDVQVSPSGDIALTPDQWTDSIQQAYIRIMTDAGDYLMYPQLGASLSQLYGMPQTANTGALGVKMIVEALTSDNTFTASQVMVKAVPTDYQTIRFDISLTAGSLQALQLSVEQNLGLT